MRKLFVYIERNGTSILVGQIQGNSADTACFSYAEKYLENPANNPISINLPLQDGSFSPEQTRCYFDGLLPEGFTRRCVAGWIHANENDYLSILAGLGKECLGAVRILEEENLTMDQMEYRILTEEEVRNLAFEGATKSAQLVTKSHLSLAGASGKAGLYYSEKNGRWYLPMGQAPSTHIVKQSHIRLKGIVANEQLSLRTARKLGIDTADSFILNTGGYGEGEVLFASKRYDREVRTDSKMLNGLPVPLRLHQEDFGQAIGIPSELKYESNHGKYLKKVSETLRRYSADPIKDLLKLGCSAAWDSGISWIIRETHLS